MSEDIFGDEIFKAGVRPGGPTSHNEIKMLICYILTTIGQSMSFSQLHEALAEHNLVNYFELVQVVDGLVQSGHLEAESSEQGEAYTATELCMQASAAFEENLPRSVREKGLESAQLLLKRQQRLSEVKIDITPQNGGYLMKLGIPEQQGELVSVSLFLPTKGECDQVKRRFLNDPVFIYKSILALMTGDSDVIGDILPQKEKLF